MTATTANADGDRLSPSAALNRFNPPEELGVETQPTQLTRARFGFRLANIGLLVDQDTVSEVMERLPVCPIPNTPPWLLGVMNVRGTLVPIFDLYQPLEIAEKSRKNRMVLMLGKGEDAVAIMIDGLPQAQDLSRQLKQLPPMPKMLKGHVSNAYTRDGVIWLDFNHRSFLTALSAQAVT